jgi:REP element-mobilizing transposase RayT
MKHVIIGSLQTLNERELIKIYGFVIMPNHIHILWEMLKPNGKESPVNSLMKFTDHEFKRLLHQYDRAQLAMFKSEKNDRIYEFWKRDPLAIPITSDKAFIQNLSIFIIIQSQRWQLCRYSE